MTILESICTNVEELLTANEVLTECNRQPKQQRSAFMMTFAVFLEWLVLRICRPLLCANDYNTIAFEVQKRFATHGWFSADLYSQISPAVKERLETMQPGRNTGVLLPMVHAIEGTNSVGHKVQHSNDARFQMYTIAAWKFIAEQIPKLCGVKDNKREKQEPAPERKQSLWRRLFR